MRVYLASPISVGNLFDNINTAIDCFHRLRREGLAPLCPALSVFAGGCWLDADYEPDAGDSVAVVAKAARLPRGTKHSDWMDVDLPWVSVSDCVLRLPGESRGADEEVAWARARGIPVFDTEAALLEWAKENR